jgi:SAM-dependent methyltransferase
MDEARSDRMDKMLFKECLRSVKSQVSSSGPRDRQLLDQIVGPGGTQQGYLSGGFVVSVGIRAALHAVSRSVYDFHRILDFGCGSARVLRWFQGAGSNAKLFGCDINPKAVEWCNAHARFAEFRVNDAWPPLPYSDQMFDLIYAISVVTHLDEQMQLAWLSELRRIVAPGGILMMSVHGEDKAANDLSGKELEEFKRSGFFYKTASEWDKSSVEGLPDFYQVAFHSERYILQTWGKFFDILAYFKHGCTLWQDLVILSARSNDGHSAQQPPVQFPIYTNLPIVTLEHPPVGVSHTGDFLRVWGWGFYPDGRPVLLEVKLDGQKLGECNSYIDRPDVEGVYRHNPGASKPGFSLVSNDMRLRNGWHVIWVNSIDDPTPLGATFFRYDEAPWYRLISGLGKQSR